jgi:hypothetical protein
VNVLHGEDDFAEVVFDVVGGKFGTVCRDEVLEELSSRVVLHEEVEVAAGLEAGVEVDCVVAVAHADEVLPFPELGHQTLVVADVVLGHSLQRHHCPGYLAADKVDRSVGALPQTHQELELPDAQPVGSAFVGVEAAEFEFAFELGEVEVGLGQPVVQEGVYLDAGQSQEGHVAGSVLLVQSLIALDNGGESPDSGAFGQREE